jgi:arabinose-5-phosphate isomerase
LNNSNTIKDLARKTISSEGQAILNLQNLINDDFVQVIECILNSPSRVVVSGIGKSAIIASKIVATLNSTGTPAIFMHAADAIHGDLGTIQRDDVVICISKSGDTPEIKMLAPLIKQGGNLLIAMTGNPDSFLSKHADYTLNTHVDKEACPNNLAPTTSTTAQLVMGDALAVCLLELRGFSSKDFARYHPGGTLGKRLYLRVADIVIQNQKPQVQEDTPVKDAIIEISKKMLGVTAVTQGEKIIGIITDGDIRRMLNTYDNIGELKAKDIMSSHPKTVDCDVLAVKALELMQENNISQLLATDENRYAGVVHIHNLIKEGIR